MVNPFNLFEFNFVAMTVVLYIVSDACSEPVFLPAALLLCLSVRTVSWLLEKLSIFKIRINRQACTDCGACVKACPGQAMKGLYEQTFFRADCFSCGECLRACAFDALSYASQDVPRTLEKRDDIPIQSNIGGTQ